MSIVGIASRDAREQGSEPSRRPYPLRRRPSRTGVAGFCVGALLFALCFLSDPGRMVFDTQLVLPVDPARFLSRALHLWDDRTGYGELSDQAYGYLFPMGPFFLLCHAIAMPAWIAQRTWMGLLLVTGFSGTVRLARLLGIGTSAGRILSGLAYALTPIVISEIGGISAEAIAQLLAPWALIPLVRACRPDGPSARSAAARSGVAILLMGGVNAFVTLAALPLPALWILTRESGAAKRRLAAWWATAVFGATCWWVVPLLVFGVYSPRFILYIESSSVTTMTTTTFDSLRGTTNWVQYVPGADGPWVRAGFAVSARPVLIVATAAVVAVGMAGLAHRRMPHRRFLVALLIVGLSLITFGHVGALTPPWAHGARTLLDGPLAPFRNIHRFDATFRLALVLGLAHAVSLVPKFVVTGAGGPARDLTRWSTGWIAHSVLAAVVLLAAAPALQGRLTNQGSYAALPSWWGQAAGYLSVNAQGERALLVPAAGFGDYDWGHTIDEPFAVLADTPWAARSQAPFAPVGNILMSDAVQQALSDGRASSGLADYLARSGVGFLVVRNDLDWQAEDTLRPSVVHATLDGSPGFAEVAAFGPASGGPPPESGPAYDTGLEPTYPAVEIYKVDRPVVRAATYPFAGTLRVSGGPDSVLDLINAGLLDDGRPTLPAADPASPTAGTRPAVTDGLRRQEVNFGRPTDHTSATLTATDPWRLERAANDYDPYPGTGDQTVATYVGAKDIRASSSGSDITATFAAGAEHLPFAAFDGDPDTYWDSANPGSPVGQWLEIDLDQPVSTPSVRVAFRNGSLFGGAIQSIAVTTDSGTVTTGVVPGEAPQAIPLPPGPATHIRFTVAEADGAGLFAVSDVAIPGVSVQRTLVAPPAVTPSATDTLAPLYAFTRSDSTTGCVIVKTVPTCSPWLARPGEEDGALDRTFNVGSQGAKLTLTGTVTPRAGPALDAMMQGTSKLSVTASSRLVDDSRVGPVAVTRPDPTTPWIAGQLDPHPSITLSWTGKRSLTELDIATTSPNIASTPRSVRVVSAQGTREAVIPADGAVKFPELKTDSVTVSFPAVRTITTEVHGALGSVTLPVGVSGLRFPALDGLAGTVAPAAPLKTTCGDGPAISVDGGAAISTRIIAKVGDAAAGLPLAFEPCAVGSAGPVPPLDLAPGKHRIRMVDSAAFQASALDLVPADLWAARGASADPAATRQTSVVTWNASRKTVRVGSGETSILVVHENANPGWQAELNGRLLSPVTVDGWQQAWIVPAGTGGDVHLSYPPDTVYRAGLFIGAATAFGVVVAAVLPVRRRRDGEETDEDDEDGDATANGGESADDDAEASEPSDGSDGSDGSDAGEADVHPEPVGAESARGIGESSRAAVFAALAGFVVMLGPWAVIPAVVALCAARVPKWAPVAAGLCYAAAGIMVALQAHGGAGNVAAAGSVLIQLLCLAALGCTAAALFAFKSWKRISHDI